LNQRSLRLIIARTPLGLRRQCDSNGGVPPSPVDSVGHRHAAALASGAGHGVRVGVSDNPPTRSPSHWQTEPGLTRRMTVRTVPLSGPNPVPETSESLGLETQNLSRREAIHNAVRGHAARAGLHPPAPCACMRSMFQYVPRYAPILANTCQYIPIRTRLRSVWAPPLPSACAAAARKDTIRAPCRREPGRQISRAAVGSLQSGCTNCPLTKRLHLIPARDTGTIPHSMHGMMDRCYPGGECDSDKANQPGKGSTLFYINLWAIVFPSDHLEE